MNRENITPEEQERRRRKAFAFAVASMQLEGEKVPDQEKRHAQRFISGEIDWDEYFNAPFE